MTNPLKSIIAGHSLPENEAEEIMQSMLHDDFAPEQIAGLLVALRMRGETVAELSGFLKALRSHAHKVTIQRTNIVDTCGTGGDGAHTFNISTAAAIIVAGAGIAVAKHGNRSVSSRCGSADVLEALRVPIMLLPAETVRCVEEIGFGFFFAPLYHPTLARVRPVRNALGVPTVFNFMGPLLNPAGVKRQLLGVSNPALLPVFADLLKKEGSEEVMIICGENGLDEISLCTPTRVAHLKQGKVEHYEIGPADFGLPGCALSDLEGGTAFKNAELIEKILKGEDQGAKRNVVLANAAATILVSGAAPDLLAAMTIARSSLDDGKALATLEKLRRFA